MDFANKTKENVFSLMFRESPEARMAFCYNLFRVCEFEELRKTKNLVLK